MCYLPPSGELTHIEHYKQQDLYQGNCIGLHFIGQVFFLIYN